MVFSSNYRTYLLICLTELIIPIDTFTPTMNRILICLTALSLGLMSCNSGKETSFDSIIFLENDTLRAGFLPGVGGRLVFLSGRDGQNLLKSDSTLWNEAPEDRIEASAEAGWKAYQGHIIWIGPQSEWWSRQEINEERRSAGARWPPDPYLEYSTFRVLEQSSVSLTLEGPSSPVSGISLRKRYTLKGSSLEIEVSMTNTSEQPVAWDIWSNARFEANTTFFVPGCEKGILKISGDKSGKTGVLNGAVVESAFTFVSQSPESGKKRSSAKAFLHPEQGKIVAVQKTSMLVMSFEYLERDQIHPEQGFVEVYKSLNPGGKDDLLELEHHTAYVSLQPGESHELRERWDIFNYQGGSSLEEAIVWFSEKIATNN